VVCVTLLTHYYYYNNRAADVKGEAACIIQAVWRGVAGRMHLHTVSYIVYFAAITSSLCLAHCHVLVVTKLLSLCCTSYLVILQTIKEQALQRRRSQCAARIQSVARMWLVRKSACVAFTNSSSARRQSTKRRSVAVVPTNGAVARRSIAHAARLSRVHARRNSGTAAGLPLMQQQAPW
jgi:IQ calmodulin-binding motif